MKTGIVVLNWNGWEDTLECMESLKKSRNSKYTCIILDNKSETESIDRLLRWINTNDGFLKKDITSNPQEEINNAISYNSNSFLLFLNNQNSGFAKGNNIAIRWLLNAGYERILLLNNDTIIYPDTLEKLINHSMKINHDVITSNIVYHHDNKIIWNSGGRFTITGTRKYYNQNKKLAHNNRGIKKIEFATGCALIVNASVFKDIGLLTEKFFFGEEDFDFCKRLKKSKKQVYCALDTVLEHKVGRSKTLLLGTDILQASSLHLINRLVCMKQYYPKPYWHIWQLMTVLYIFLKFSILRKTNPKNILRFSRIILHYSTNLESVQFEAIKEIKDHFK